MEETINYNGVNYHFKVNEEGRTILTMTTESSSKMVQHSSVNDKGGNWDRIFRINPTDGRTD